MIRVQLLLLFLIITASSWAQQYNFINYSVEEGLAQSQVPDMVQDQGGYLWVATRGGLSRFDGKQFTNFSKNQGLISNQLSDLLIDENNHLWVGAEGGISLFTNNKFKSFQFKEDFSKYQVNEMIFFNDTLYIATNGGGVILFHDEQFIYPETSAQLNIRSIDVFNGKTILGTINGLYFLQNDLSVTPIQQLSSLAETSISFVHATTEKLYIGTYSEKGVLVFDQNYTKKKNFTVNNGLYSNFIRSMFIDQNHNLWLISKYGVEKVTQDDNIKRFYTGNGLSHNNITCAIEDIDGNMWFGFDGKGICLFTGEAFVNYQKSDGISSDFVMNIVEDSAHNLWFSTYGGGITKWKDGNNLAIYTVEDGLPNNTVWASLVDHENVLWFGTSKGVVQLREGKFEQVIPGNDQRSKVTYLFEDSQKRVWIGAQHGVWVNQNDSLLFMEVKDGLKGNNIRAITEDENGVIWLGSQIGLYRYQDGKFKYIPINSEETHTVYSLKYAKSHLWVGTNNGLFIQKNGAFEKIELSDNFNANTINFLQPYKNEMWVGTNNGLYQIEDFASSQSNITHYNSNDGLKSLESNLNASFLSQNDKLWFGTGGGLLRYDPKIGAQNNKMNEPNVHITGIRLFLEAMDYQKYGEGIDESTGLPYDLTMPYNKNHITFDFIGISLKSPESIRYKYKLEGFDSDWSPVTSSPLATYSNLPFGTYTFMIMAKNKSGIWSAPVSYTFEIKPPFWRTWWFYGVCIIAASILVYLIVLIRSRIMARKRATQQLVYKSKLAALEQQSLNASMNRHFIFNALNSIQYFINTSDKISANRYLTNFAKLIRKNLDSTTTENHIVPLQEEIDRIQLYLSLESMRFDQKFKYEIDVDESLDTELINVPSMMLQPYIENGIIHGILPKDEPGVIKLKVFKENASVVFDIEDDGVGIDNSIELKKKATSTEGDHISKGMEITSSRITLLQKITEKDITIKGPYQIKNDKKYPGTRVIIKLPLN